MTELKYLRPKSHLVSYLQDYLLGHKLRKKKSISGKQFLYTQFQNSPPRNRKIEYVAKDINVAEESCRYLWIPPLRPYYEGKGIFRNDVLRRLDIKKGLIFSSWKFVPRQIAAELSRMRDSHFRTTKKKYQIKVTPVTWCSFFHPSKVLAESLSHENFVNIGTYEKLKKCSVKYIGAYLKRQGIQVTKGRKSSKAWEVLLHLEYYHDRNSWKNLIRAYRKRVSRSRQSHEKNTTQLIEPRYLNYLKKGFDETITVNKKTIEELANIAISSPAVAIRRGMSSIIGEKTLLLPSIMEELVRICLIEIRSYVSRYTTIQCVKAAYKNGSYHKRIANYFRDGNTQAVIDEFLFCIVGTLDKQNAPHDVIIDLLYKFKSVFQYRKSVLMPFKGKRARHRVNTHLAMAFGESQQEGISRDDLRIAFKCLKNS